jgi:hypothetical protein
MALRPRLQQLEPKTPRTGWTAKTLNLLKTPPKTHPRLSLFHQRPLGGEAFFAWVAVIPSDHLQAVASISRKPSLFLVDPTQKRAGVAVPALVPATLATRQPIVSRRRIGDQLLEAGWAGKWGAFFF